MSWSKERSASESLEILETLSGYFLERGGAQCSSLREAVENKDYLSIINFQIDYSGDINDITMARQVQALYSKLDCLPISVDREQVALKKFLECEELCRETNKRLRLSADPRLAGNTALQTMMFIAQRKISSVLGCLPSLETLDFSFGPGGNTNVKSAVAMPRAKLSAELACSANMVPVLSDFLAEIPLWVSVHAASETSDSFIVDVQVHSGKLMFVPKNSKTDRPIVVEPVLNSFFQKGYGSYIRGRLSRVGIDLLDQTHNKNLACTGSIDGSLATIDLSSASDCIARNLVYSLLPIEWATQLDYLRSPYVEYGSEVIKLEKFSSMGNGYTFELESLIFFSLAYAVCEYLGLPKDRQHLSVYGDDIIIPVEAAETLYELLDWCGFIPNKEKSYSTGKFRESCGADYLSGIDIRPLYVKTRISDQNLFAFHNFFMRRLDFATADFIKGFMNPTYILYGPDGFGDGHLIGSYSLRQSRNVQRSGWEGGFFDTYSLRSRFFKKTLPGDYALPAYSVYVRSGERDPTDPDVVRGSRGYSKISIYTLTRGVFYN